MQIENDIKNAINIVNRKVVDKKEYRSVKLFPDRTLKMFRQFKNNTFKDKKVLTKCNSLADILDLVSYGADVTCYSTNRFDEYFLKLQLALLEVNYKEYFSYFFGRYSYNGYKMFSIETYNKIKESLDENTRYFFDELYKCMPDGSFFNSNLCNSGKNSHEVLEMYVRYFLAKGYNEARKCSKQYNPDFILCKDSSVPEEFKTEIFNFINLSYNIDKMDSERLKHIMDKINSDFLPILKENGYIIGFSSKYPNDLEGYERLETRSILDPYSSKDSCKKEYSYVYKKMTSSY